MKLKIKFSPLFFILILLSFISRTVLQCFIYFIMVILHEFAHYATAQKFGYELNTLHLMPYGAALSGNLSAATCGEEILIAVAGPLFNLICAVFFVALWWVSPAIYVFSDTIVLSNVAIALFNILPVYPLDGGRILYAVLKSKMVKRANLIMKIVAFTVSGVFFSICLLLALSKKINFSFALAAVFIMAGTFIKDKDAYYQNLYSMTYRTQKIRKGLTVKEMMVFEDETISSLIKKISSAYYTKFTVVDNNLQTLCVLTESKLLELATKFHQNSTISNIIRENSLKSF